MISPIDTRGASLAEVLVSLLILSLLAGGLHQFYRVMMENVAVLETASEAQESTQIGVDLMQRDLRAAGYSQDGSIESGVLFAASDAIGIEMDLNGDHDTQDANERIAYRFDPDGRRLMRQMGDAPPQPMLNSLAQKGFILEYRTEDGNLLQFSDGAFGHDDRKQIRRIDIDLIVEIPHPYRAAAEPIRCRQTSTVSLRNGT